MRYRFGEFVLDPDRYLLRRGPEPVEVEPRVFEVLAYLVEHAGRVVSRDELLDRFWGDVHVTDAALTHAVAEGRRALGDSAGEKRWIETVYGRGYRFSGPVEEVAGDDVADDFYRRGRELFRQDVDHSIRLARRMFERAIEIDPGHALAHAGLADTLIELRFYRGGGDAEGALAASRRAVELAPRSATVRACRGNVLGLVGRHDEAEAELERSRELDPGLFDAYYFHARVCWSRGDLERAADLLEQASAVEPEDFVAPALLVQAYRGLGLEERRREAARRARRLAEEYLVDHPDDTRALCLGSQASLVLGDADRAEALIRRTREIDPDETCTLYNTACLRATQGRGEEALDLLERAVRSGYRHRAWTENDPDLASLREHSRFRSLLDRMEGSAARPR
ncbi:MAG: TPR end-of-group domain-containing protein [Thermoanaerobaculia bacterium]